MNFIHFFSSRSFDHILYIHLGFWTISINIIFFPTISFANPSSSPLGTMSSEIDVWWVRWCCFMLSFRVKALLHIGQWTLFLLVCFFPCRAAWPEVIKLARHACEAAYGQGYLLFLLTLKVLKSPIPLSDDGGDGGFPNITSGWAVVSSRCSGEPELSPICLAPCDRNASFILRHHCRKRCRHSRRFGGHFEHTQETLQGPRRQPGLDSPLLWMPLLKAVRVFLST